MTAQLCQTVMHARMWGALQFGMVLCNHSEDTAAHTHETSCYDGAAEKLKFSIIYSIDIFDF
jgi:hypothetical protein